MDELERTVQLETFTKLIGVVHSLWKNAFYSGMCTSTDWKGWVQVTMHILYLLKTIFHILCKLESVYEKSEDTNCEQDQVQQ